MKVSEAMSRDVQVARPEDTIQSAARRMAQVDAGSLPVCDAAGLQGVITDRDIVIRAVSEGRSFETPVSEIMTTQPHCVFVDDSVDDAAERMAELQIRRLPVLDRDRRLVGILALGDITGRVKDKTAGQTLEDISKSTRQN